MALISDYAMLADCHSAALVSRAGSVDWWCPSRFDAPSVLGRLLDEDAGHWVIEPRERASATRSYLDGTMVVATEFATGSGAFRLTDALLLGEGERAHRIGYASPHVLVRRVEGLSGEVAVDLELVVRPEYGLVVPGVARAADGIRVAGGADRMLLTGDRPLEIDTTRGRVHGTLLLRAGEVATFALQHRHASDHEQLRVDGSAALEDTITGWRSWAAAHQGYEGPYQEQVLRSGLVPQALTYRPTGAVVAAPTTSLPEEVGGTANWDYRYGWLRDGSFTLKALWVAACPDEAGRFLSFLINAAGTSPGRAGGLQIMYGIGGEHDLAERELSHLEGWRSSRPVRIGNAAWDQTQNDGYGALLDAVYRYREDLGDIEPEAVELLVSIATAAAEVWTEPDQGIWELRGEPRHHLHSKLMCWVALDRAVRLADQFGVARHAPEWAETADLIRRAILEEGWSDKLGAYTQSFGSAELDSSTLLLAITGFLPASDPRMRSTIEQIAARLSAPCGLLYRYLDDGDGLDGGESPFLICSYWLAECWALAGDLGAAREIFERATAYANDVGLLSEEADPATGELLGNFPQAFSHIGLVNAAWTISQAEAGMPPGGCGQ